MDGDILYVKTYDEDSLLQANKKKSSIAKKQAPGESEAPEFNKNQDSKGNDALGMLKFILSETEREEKTAHETEEKAQASYEDEMNRLAEEERAFLEVIVRTEADLAEKEKLLVEKTANHDETVKDKKSALAYLQSIKPGCDFIDQNLDVRKESRRAEKEKLLVEKTANHDETV